MNPPNPVLAGKKALVVGIAAGIGLLLGILISRR